jgi:hypothetical protein
LGLHQSQQRPQQPRLNRAGLQAQHQAGNAR